MVNSGVGSFSIKRRTNVSKEFRCAWEAGQFVSKMAFRSQRPLKRFLADFAYSSNTLEEDSQEYEDVESSQIYIPDSDETQINE